MALQKEQKYAQKKKTSNYVHANWKMWKEKPKHGDCKESKRMGKCNLQFWNTSTRSPKRSKKSHKLTWGWHKNASLGKFSVLLCGSTGSCDFCNILDLVTFLAPECWTTFAWCFATHTVGAVCDGPTSGVEYRELITLKMHDVHITQNLCAAPTGWEKLVEFSAIFGFSQNLNDPQQANRNSNNSIHLIGLDHLHCSKYS